MKQIKWILFSVALLSRAAFAQGHDHGHGDHEHEKKAPAKKGELHVYLADEDKNPVPLTDVKVTLIIEPNGGKRRVLKATLVNPEGKKKWGIGHGGEVREMKGYHVEFVVVQPHHHEAEGEHEHKSEDGTPYFKAAIDLVGFSCGMTGDPVLAKQEQCPKCGMKTKPVDLTFSAVIIFRIGENTVNVKGFAHPPTVPAHYSDAVAKMLKLFAPFAKSMRDGDDNAAHSTERMIMDIAEALSDLEGAKDKSAIKNAVSKIEILFKDIDKANHHGKKAEASKLIDQLKEKIHHLEKYGGEESHKPSHDE